MKYILTVFGLLIFLVVGTIVFALSGAYNISATTPHWKSTLVFINMFKDRSIEVHSKKIKALNLNDPELYKEAFPHYHEMCRLCHGAPGFEPLEFTNGFYPEPPSMVSGEIQKSLSGNEIFWIVKHGIKMTGMPAFGPTHDDNIIRGLTALTISMPGMTPDQYKDLGGGKISEESDHEHHHDHESHEEEAE